MNRKDSKVKEMFCAALEKKTAAELLGVPEEAVEEELEIEK